MHGSRILLLLSPSLIPCYSWLFGRGAATWRVTGKCMCVRLFAFRTRPCDVFCHPANGLTPPPFLLPSMFSSLCPLSFPCLPASLPACLPAHPPICLSVCLPPSPSTCMAPWVVRPPLVAAPCLPSGRCSRQCTRARSRTTHLSYRWGAGAGGVEQGGVLCQWLLVLFGPRSRTHLSYLGVWGGGGGLVVWVAGAGGAGDCVAVVVSGC